MDAQVALVTEALRAARNNADLSTNTPLTIAVSRPHAESTVTLTTHLPPPKTSAPSYMRAHNPPLSPSKLTAADLASSSLPSASVGRHLSAASFFEKPDAIREVPFEGVPRGISGESDHLPRGMTTNSFFDSDTQVTALLTEIERLKRKALSRGVNLTSPHEAVPAEDVAMLRQVFTIADTTAAGSIDMDELTTLHHVLGEPLMPDECKSAFRAMDMDRNGRVTFEDFLAWYTLAHSRSGMLSKKGLAYTKRFKKIMTRLSETFDLNHLSIASSGAPRSLEYRVKFFFNDRGVLKQISPWHDIPLYASDGNVHMITEIPKFSRAKFEIATGEPLNPIKQDVKNGKLREYNHGDMLFNYGALPQTWEDPSHTTPDTGHVGDNDPIDIVEIGTKILRTGSVTKVKVLGCLAMIDDGETDWKVISIACDDPLAAQLHDIADVEVHMPGYIATLREWLRDYKTVDGKPQNTFGLDERALDRKYTLGVIEETHTFWRRLTETGQKEV